MVFSDALADALMDHGGIYGPFLSLVEAVESGDQAQLENLSSALMLSPGQVSEAHLQALAWVEQLGLD